ncbi:neural proliferation differentiation and control protein 1 isoform X3 [Alexandromys fortis]|uniref:neural proliferation differentiation and control protein 1 isoform X3 n=1 Tax=Alexandromys fortis TaxID=100897 RepID=UPI002152F880|nr:neural proliferation differentiation and control protein 1 isoform X3 [Microtus fortis]
MQSSCHHSLPWRVRATLSSGLRSVCVTLQKSPVWEITLARWVLKLQDPNRISLKGAKWESVPICSLSSGALKGRCFEPSLQMRKLRHGEMTDDPTCPGSLDCALKRRARCPPGAHACGPCLQSFQEDQRGLCVPRMHQSPAATQGFSKWGQGLEPGLPSSHGTSLPTPHASLGSPVSSGPVHKSPLESRGRHGSSLILVLALSFCLVSIGALALAALFWYRLQREIRLTQKADYAATTKVPASPATPRISPGDQRLAHSAEMYHYQHQRQQMLCLERHKEPPKELETASSDEENEDGDFTVYECPGLAPTGEMEVRNPLFDHSSLSAPVPGPHSSPPLQ